TIAAIAKELNNKIGVDQNEFKSACKNKLLLWKWGISEDSVEGYLFPNTYLFSEEEDVQDIIGRMINEYKERITLAFRDRMKVLGMNENEIITLASIIEGEAIYDSERAVISGVYHNRLNIGMRLQADPTIQYIITDSPRRLLNKDLKIKSPYNTYLNKGLPPGPINNPGIESIKAALYPDETDYIYFVATGDGYHTFSRTKEEHNIAKRKFQKIRRQLKRQQKKKDNT
ncbi:MAG: endolytic transglycosylase MltG, partial [Fidelibacterota bacterium]